MTDPRRTLSSFASLFACAALLLPACTGNPEPEPEPEPEPPIDDDGGVDVDGGADEEGAPRARVYLTNPDDGEPAEVELDPPTSDGGTLTNGSVNALNCLNQEGGESIFGGFATLCVERQTVLPDEDGNYFSTVPPNNVNDGQDPFAELQMYHHVNVVHDYYSTVHGLTDLDFPLDAVVNITVNFNGSWSSFPNAAFVPAESFAAFGLPERDYGAIMFGQGDAIDFSYDASVIYHEYTHAVVGTGRLNGIFMDNQGLDNTPGAVNEAIADYFASTILDDPLLGAYALGASARDLASPRSCPDNLTTQIHADGKIISTALWAARDTLGAEVMDAIVFDALMSANASTGISQMGELVLAEAANVDADTESVIANIFAAQGVVDCTRVKPWVDVTFANTAERVPHTVAGTQTVTGFSQGVPGYHQWSIDGISNGDSVVLSWTQGEGGGFPPATPTALNLVLNKGAPVQLNLQQQFLADAVLDAIPLDGTTQTVTLSGNCLPADGTLYVMFANPGGSDAAVESMSITVGNIITPEGVLVTCD